MEESIQSSSVGTKYFRGQYISTHIPSLWEVSLVEAIYWYIFHSSWDFKPRRGDILVEKGRSIQPSSVGTKYFRGNILVPIFHPTGGLAI
jgi:hypothetical protein